MALLKDPANPLQAGREVYPENTGDALAACQLWRNDPGVLAYVAAVHNTVGRGGELPTNHEYAVYLWQLVQETRDDDLKLKYLRIYAEATGQLKRPQGEGDGADGGKTVNVMVVNHMGTDEDYFKVAKKSQAQLQEDLEIVAAEFEVMNEDA